MGVTNHLLTEMILQAILAGSKLMQMLPTSWRDVPQTSALFGVGVI